MDSNDTLLSAAAQILGEAEALLIGAGAGMGVDSGLPDFRGDQGFWRAYPVYEKLGLDFISLANPEWFATDPAVAWGFYGHRLNLYRRVLPHAGFVILREWASAMRRGSFVATSNVDGQFQRAGFASERLLEIHGAIDWLQCVRSCGAGLFAADSFSVDIDETTMRARDPLPACPACGALARPNILMFGDYRWDSTRTDLQLKRFHAWLESIRGAKLVIVECGAGTAVPSVRNLCEQVAADRQASLIRINPREAMVPGTGHIGLPIGSLAALSGLKQRLSGQTES